MTHRERLDCVFAGGVPDTTAILGGWIADPNLLIGAAGVSRDEYAGDPMRYMVKAHENLGIDGLIAIMGMDVDRWRIVDEHSYIGASLNDDFDAFIRAVEALPSADEVERSFDFDVEYATFAAELKQTQAQCGELVYMPAQWSAGARASWFQTYGYENFFMLVALHPKLAGKLFAIGGAEGYNRGRLIARAVGEGLYPKAVLLGEDVCAQRGPMMSVDFLREYYAPALAHGLEPLLNAGIRPVWHCDGNVMPMLPMLFECGIQGLQGFQPECGMKIEELVKLRTREDKKLLIFGPMSVTTELNALTPKEIERLVRHHVEICRDTVDLVYLTANTINPDVSLENLLTMYRTLR